MSFDEITKVFQNMLKRLTEAKQRLPISLYISEEVSAARQSEYQDSEQPSTSSSFRSDILRSFRIKSPPCISHNDPLYNDNIADISEGNSGRSSSEENSVTEVWASNYVENSTIENRSETVGATLRELVPDTAENISSEISPNHSNFPNTDILSGSSFENATRVNYSRNTSASLRKSRRNCSSYRFNPLANSRRFSRTLHPRFSLSSLEVNTGSHSQQNVASTSASTVNDSEISSHSGLRPDFAEIESAGSVNIFNISGPTRPTTPPALLIIPSYSNVLFSAGANTDVEQLISEEDVFCRMHFDLKREITKIEFCILKTALSEITQACKIANSARFWAGLLYLMYDKLHHLMQSVVFNLFHVGTLFKNLKNFEDKFKEVKVIFEAVDAQKCLLEKMFADYKKEGELLNNQQKQYCSLLHQQYIQKQKDDSRMSRMLNEIKKSKEMCRQLMLAVSKVMPV